MCLCGGENELMPRVQPPPSASSSPCCRCPRTRARTRGTWAGFPCSVPRLGWESAFRKEAEPAERAEGLEPQVTARQRGPPAVTLAGWPGEGTRPPALCCGNPGYLANNPHHG
ncbi:hypothetical protein MC885_016767 [Smutsia gigantea]|nr:hypothetical protein MC885_016767 [Smutsia gigantea]